MTIPKALFLGSSPFLLAGAGYFFLPPFFSVSYSQNHQSATNDQPPAATNAAAHAPRPNPLKAVYMTQCVAGTPSFRDSLVKLIDSTELNAIVIDIKDFSGKIAFPTNHILLKDSVSEKCGAVDMESFIKTLHEKNVYVIGRITVFQDPYYAKSNPGQAVQKTGGGVWYDRKGLAFVDVGARPFWDYIVELGKLSYAIGFDELNFDYIRFPSDGNMSEAVYTWSIGKSKGQALEEFFQYLSQQLKPTDAILSADLFGYTTVHNDDLGIGQILERALPYFDYIYPMVYPSHYNSGFAGLADPNSDPYKVVYTSLEQGIERELATTTKQTSFVFAPIASTSPQLYEKPVYYGKVVPWLQDFDYPVDYTPQMVRDQIRAARDAGIDSWLFWDAGNKYSSLRQVLAQPAVDR